MNRKEFFKSLILGATAVVPLVDGRPDLDLATKVTRAASAEPLVGLYSSEDMKHLNFLNGAFQKRLEVTESCSVVDVTSHNEFPQRLLSGPSSYEILVQGTVISR